jgi:hypothetical protein
MVRLLRFAGQGLIYVAGAALLGYFSSHPVYRQFPQDKAQLKLSFAHGAERAKACRRLTSKEIAKLPPNERRPNTCERRRVAVHVQLDVDGKRLLDARLEPIGLAGDGPARIYRKFVVNPGTHMVIARLRDSRAPDGFNYETRREIFLAEGQNMAIDFKADAGGFIFR